MKKLYKAISTAALAGIIGALPVIPTHVYAASSSVKSTTTSSSTVNASTPSDSTVIKNAQKKLQEITGKKLELVYKQALGNEIELSVKGQGFDQVSTDKNGNITDAHVEVGNRTFMIKNNKLDHTVEDVDTSKADKTALKAAEGVFGALDGVTKGNLKHISLIAKGNKKVFEFMFQNGDKESPVWIQVEKGSNQVMSINTRILADKLFGKDKAEVDTVEQKLKSFSEDQILELAQKQDKELLNVDLTGYKVIKNTQMHGRVTFEKDHSPKLSGDFNSKGQFYSLKVEY
ncbi:hypothetical protein NS115_16835 [Paenibacillus jamilae]|uniref:Uncharacterized protein n=1 Tax=Paenibacillus jamilae TaxID=114136 RepID=A0ACC4ZSR0_9BACL|nr:MULTISPECIES: hypothetical protein [Paenibacillus]AUO06534.1 hypothetical protein C0638_08315 [Paenibacillus sp. lzh-N1]KTS81233.1 hypothetical protein NS115_16835 [Paenibacillus jamilae]